LQAAKGKHQEQVYLGAVSKLDQVHNLSQNGYGLNASIICYYTHFDRIYLSKSFPFEETTFI